MPRPIPSCLHSRPTPSVALGPFLFSHPSIARHHERSPRELPASGDRSDVAGSARPRTTPEFFAGCDDDLHPIGPTSKITRRAHAAREGSKDAWGAKRAQDVTETQDLFLARATWGTAVKRTGGGFRTGRPNGSILWRPGPLGSLSPAEVEPSQGTAQRIMGLTREGGDQGPCLERVKTAAEGQDEPRLASGVWTRATSVLEASGSLFETRRPLFGTQKRPFDPSADRGGQMDRAEMRWVGKIFSRGSSEIGWIWIDGVSPPVVFWTGQSGNPGRDTSSVTSMTFYPQQSRQQ